MDKSNLHKLNTILKRYKLAHRILNDDDIEFGGGNNIKYFKRYYFYMPLLIGVVIVVFGFLIDFILFKFSGVPFLLYAVYGISQINSAIKDNRNTTIVRNGEIIISVNGVVTKLNAENIKDFEIKNEPLDDELHLGQLSIKDKKNHEHLILSLVDDELPILKEDNYPR